MSAAWPYRTNMKTAKVLQTGAALGMLGLALMSAPRTANGQQYVWPLEESKNLTSGFCDHRAAHYHGGIDISTGGIEGLKVHAADSGFVYRISTSYWGMGKVLYVKLADGRIAVYGHLSQFAEPVRRYVEAQQYSLQRYNTNLFPLPDELPVRRGEVVAYTGQTGAGAPHLHFEIRTAANFPVNPLTVDVGYPDRTPPEFQGVLVRPLLVVDPRAKVQNAPDAVYLKVEKAPAAGHYVVKKSVWVTGAVGLEVRVGDPTGYMASSITPHRLTVKVNGTRWFEITHDSLDYDLARQVDLAYDFAWLTEHGDDLLALYRRPANQLPWYDPKLGDGILKPQQPGSPVVPGNNKIEISAFDAAGNEAVMEMTLVFNQVPQAQDVRLRETGGQWHLTGTAGDPDGYVARLVLYRKPTGVAPLTVAWERNDSLTSERFDYLVPNSFAPGERLTLVLIDGRGAECSIPLEVPGTLASELKPKSGIDVPARGEFVPGGLTIQPLAKGGTVPATQVALRIHSKDSLPPKWASYLDVQEFLRASAGGAARQFVPSGDPLVESVSWEEALSPVTPDENKAVLSPDSLAAARFKSGDLYDVGFFRIRAYTVPRELKPRPASKVYSFEPASVPFARKLKVGISYADLAARVDDLALYALSDDRKSWVYLGRDVDADTKSMIAAVWSFGAYALVADTMPPMISAVVPGKDAKITDLRPEITFTLSDNLAGIGSDTDIRILLDGEWLIPEYDPETLKAKTKSRADLSLGKHKLEITVRDRVGHEKSFLRYFTVAKTSG